MEQGIPARKEQCYHGIDTPREEASPQLPPAVAVATPPFSSTFHRRTVMGQPCRPVIQLYHGDSYLFYNH